MDDIIERLEACNRALEGAAWCDNGKVLKDLPKGIIESTSISTTCLIEVRNNNDLIVNLREWKPGLLKAIHNLFSKRCLEETGAGKEAQEILLKEGLITKDQYSKE